MEKYISITELAEHFSVSVSTIRSWIRSRKILPTDFIKAGKTYRFKITDIENALHRSEFSPSPEIKPSKSLKSTTNKPPLTVESISPNKNSVIEGMPQHWDAEISDRLNEQIQIVNKKYLDVLNNILPKEAEIWTLRMEGKTYVSIGRRLNITRQTASVMFLRATRKFRHPSRRDSIRKEILVLSELAKDCLISYPELEEIIRYKFGPLVYFLAEDHPDSPRFIDFERSRPVRSDFQ